MSAARLLRQAREAGLSLGVSPSGKLSYRGPPETVQHLLPALTEHRDALLAVLRAERDEAVVTVPAGDDAFEVARTLLTMTRALDAAGELPAGRAYRFRLTHQHDADRRNAEAMRAGVTDRFCACGALATFAFDEGGQQIWKCLECGPTDGRA